MESLNGNNVFTIQTYIDEYKNKVKEFLIEVAIDEFGFEEWRPYFESAKFLDLNQKQENFWIAIDNENNVIGTAGISKDININVAKLHSLYVKKDYRKRGIATELYKKCMEFAIKSGYKTIILHTYREFEEAVKFYKKKGFKINTDIKSKDVALEKNHVWHDYFANIRNKYNMRVSIKKPLIINLDGKGITNNPFFSLIDTKAGGFLDIMEKAVKYFTSKYNCISIFGTDEVSFIFENPKLLINELNTDMNTKSDEVISMFSQLFFDYFNSLAASQKVFWHGETFTIPYGKINSYIKYKSESIKNVLTTYFLKKNNIKDAGRIKLSKKLEECKKHSFYENKLKEIQNGILYLNGDRIDIEEFLNGNIKIINSQPKQEVNDFLDITKFDWDDE